MGIWVCGCVSVWEVGTGEKTGTQSNQLGLHQTDAHGGKMPSRHANKENPVFKVQEKMYTLV